MGIAVLLGAAVLGSALVGTAVAADGDAPLAEAGLDQEVRLGETVWLDATGSYDPDGRVVDFEWRVRTPGGSTVSPLEPRAARTSFPATAVGRYEVSLTVTDADGNAGTDTMYVLVEGGGGGGGSTGSSTAASTGASATTGTPDTSSNAPGTRSRNAGTATGGGAVDTTCTADGGFAVGDCPTPRDARGSEPWARIEGPMVVESGQSHTYTATAGGLSDDRTYEWEEGDTGRRHTLAFESHGTYTTRVTVADAEGRTARNGLQVFVAPIDNERPEAEITDPGPISAGERVTLSVDASDPDGRVRTTEWSPGRRVRVPTDGSTRTVRVTVTDDDGASVTDAISVSGRTTNRTVVGTDTTDVTCYFTDERQRDGRHPYSDRCIRENGNTVSLTNGPSRIEEFRENEKIDLHWRRTTRERLDGLDADDTSTDYGAAAGSPQDEADTYGRSDDRVRRVIVDQRTRVENDETFDLKGETVEDDLTGDGEVNAADWDQRYRTTGDAADVDQHADAVTGFKQSIRGDAGRDERSALDSARPASASTVRGPFAGTSIDAETRRDRISDLSRRTRAGGDDGADSGGSDGAGDDSGSTGGSSPPLSTDAGDTDHADSTGGTGGTGDASSTDDHGNIGGTSGTSTAARDASSGGSNGTGSGSGGPSRHSPHGGRIVALP